mmetsp:Transcript_24243/g.70157  ORF Transcript_24243/g.70157 Transcript_24243/m.70157 type:complete len:246 (-) Transcript_24243:89-826(-)
MPGSPRTHLFSTWRDVRSPVSFRKIWNLLNLATSSCASISPPRPLPSKLLPEPTMAKRRLRRNASRSERLGRRARMPSLVAWGSSVHAPERLSSRSKSRVSSSVQVSLNAMMSWASRSRSLRKASKASGHLSPPGSSLSKRSTISSATRTMSLMRIGNRMSMALRSSSRYSDCRSAHILPMAKSSSPEWCKKSVSAASQTWPSGYCFCAGASLKAARYCSNAGVTPAETPASAAAVSAVRQGASR